ncbi:MAG: phage protein [Luteimonas sp.]|nr:phage protein [Luteimonas sp.]
MKKNQTPDRTVVCLHCHAEHPEAHRQRVVHNHMPLSGPWVGWRMAGRELVSPEGDRISVRRLVGILWSERSQQRILKTIPRQKPEIVVLPARESFTDIA